MMIETMIQELIAYGLHTKLIQAEDEIYVRNLMLDILGLDSFEAVENIENTSNRDLEDILKDILAYACEKGICEDNIIARDLFDTKLMNTMLARPSTIIQNFWEAYETSPVEATNYYYKLSCDSDYIRRYRIKKDLKWVTQTKYGDLDITINLSKPEKDPKAIAAQKKAKPSGYPKCLLCKENVGYAGRSNHPARQNHRIIPITINGADWFMQYSPYVYYNEHCIIFNGLHTPMKIERAAFEKLFSFVEQFPHYMLGSNADLPIVGGSILSHDHFQGGRYEFAMAKAEDEIKISFHGHDSVYASIIKWPMSVIRLRGKSTKEIVDVAEKILDVWRGYSDSLAFIYAYTDNEPHNTITPIARYKDGYFELDLVLRNNITTPEHPDGLYHPHAHLHHIKKENIGLIEVMGLAVLPSRLKEEMQIVKEYLLSGKDVSENEKIAKHATWAKKIIEKYENLENIDTIIQDEIGLVFEQVLEDAGVYKCTKEGREAFLRFIDAVNEK